MRLIDSSSYNYMLKADGTACPTLPIINTMKATKCLAAISLLLAGCMVSYHLGYDQGRNNSKDYEAACHMSDLIRCYQDHLNEDSTIEDYGCFDELVGIFLYDDAVVDNPVNLRDYSWCY